MAEAISDNVFNVESNKDYLYSLSNTPNTPIINTPIINKNIQRILISRNPEDVRIEFNEFNEDMGDDNAKELVSSLELHSSSSQDAIYSQ